LEFFPPEGTGLRLAQSKNRRSIVTRPQSSIPNKDHKLRVPRATHPLPYRVLRGHFDFDFSQLYFTEDGFVYEQVRISSDPSR
jgi:hypothetical protein